MYFVVAVEIGNFDELWQSSPCFPHVFPMFSPCFPSKIPIFIAKIRPGPRHPTFDDQIFLEGSVTEGGSSGVVEGFVWKEASWGPRRQALV
jgi:hypothetical protein